MSNKFISFSLINTDQIELSTIDSRSRVIKSFINLFRKTTSHFFNRWEWPWPFFIPKKAPPELQYFISLNALSCYTTCWVCCCLFSPKRKWWVSGAISSPSLAWSCLCHFQQLCRTDDLGRGLPVHTRSSSPRGDGAVLKAGVRWDLE